MENTTHDPLDDLAAKLIKNGMLRPDQIRSWTFKELYLADPATLEPDMRRLQIEYHNSKGCAALRVKHGLSDH